MASRCWPRALRCRPDRLSKLARRASLSPSVVACSIVASAWGSRRIPRGLFGPVIPVTIGSVSTLMGIGGGTLSVMAMTLSGKLIHVAVGTASLFGLVIALPAAAGYVIAGWGNPLLPVASLGYVNLLAVVAIAPTTVLFAPLGARIAHALPRRQLSALFGLFLLIVAVRMGIRAFG